MEFKRVWTAEEIVSRLLGFIVAILIIVGLAYVLINAYQSSVQAAEQRDACWQEYGNRVVAEVPARCAALMGITP